MPIQKWRPYPHQETAMDAQRKKPKSAKDNAEEVSALNQLETTNVVLVLLQQFEFFAKWWAEQEKMKPIGIAQRFLFTFASSEPPASIEWQHFNTDVAYPIIKELFSKLLKSVGPRIALPLKKGLAVWKLSDQQELSLKAMQNLLYDAQMTFNAKPTVVRGLCCGC